MSNTSIENLRNAGQQLVAKRNDFIQEARFSLNLLQNKVLLYMFSKVKPTDTPDTLYEYQYSEMFALMNYKTDSYTEVKKLIQGLNSLSFWRDAEDENQDDELITFFQGDSVVANAKKGYFKAKFSSKLFPYILDLNEQAKNGEYYTTYRLQNVILMKHYYSQRLYEILKSYQYNNQKWIFEIGTGTKNDLQRRIAEVDPETMDPIIPESWKTWYAFNRDVLQPAKDDINKYTDIKIEYIPSKVDLSGNKHRKYISVTFAMVKKTEKEQIETNKFIDSQYKNLDEEDTHQITLDEFINAHKKLEDEENGKKKNEEVISNSSVESRIESSKIPILTESIGNQFTDDQIEALFNFSIRKLGPGKVPFDKQDAWATDYITYYLDYINATPDDTKTTVYKRLLDTVRKDYDEKADDFAKQYPKKKPADIDSAEFRLSNYIMKFQNS